MNDDYRYDACHLGPLDMSAGELKTAVLGARRRFNSIPCILLRALDPRTNVPALRSGRVRPGKPQQPQEDEEEDRIEAGVRGMGRRAIKPVSEAKARGVTTMKRSFSSVIIVTAALLLVRCADQSDGADHLPRADHFPGRFTVQDGGPVETANVPSNKYSALADAMGLSDVDERNFHLFGMSSDPCVIFDGGRYRMWFSAVQNNDLGGGPVPDRGEYIPAIDQLNLQGLAYTESADGVSWSDPKNLTNNVDLQINCKKDDCAHRFERTANRYTFSFAAGSVEISPIKVHCSDAHLLRVVVKDGRGGQLLLRDMLSTTVVEHDSDGDGTAELYFVSALACARSLKVIVVVPKL